MLVHNVSIYDLTDKNKLSVWVSNWRHTSGGTCESVRNSFRLDRYHNHVYLDIFNTGQFVPAHPNYEDYVELRTGADGREWRRFEVQIPGTWRKSSVKITFATIARSWCANYLVDSKLYIDDLEILD